MAAVGNLRSRAHELAARGREAVRDYTWERVADRYATIYRSALST